MRYNKENTKFNRRYGMDFKCAVCGDEFKSRSRYAKYCSRRCANDAAIAKRKRKTDARREWANHCKACGQPMEQDPAAKIRRYCSAACKQSAYRARKRAQAPRVSL